MHARHAAATPAVEAQDRVAQPRIGESEHAELDLGEQLHPPVMIERQQLLQDLLSEPTSRGVPEKPGDARGTGRAAAEARRAWKGAATRAGDARLLPRRAPTVPPVALEHAQRGRGDVFAGERLGR
jgi:hypothetical protein